MMSQKNGFGRSFFVAGHVASTLQRFQKKRGSRIYLKAAIIYENPKKIVIYTFKYTICI